MTGPDIPELRTERLRLRGWREDDVAPLARMYGDPLVTRYLGNGETLDRVGTWRSVAGMIGHWVMRGYGQWAVEETSTGRLLGRCGLLNPEGWPGLEVGWVLAREHWGRGFATEAARAAVAYAWAEVRTDELISLIRPENAPSIRVAERLGERYDRTIELMGGPALVYRLVRPH